MQHTVNKGPCGHPLLFHNINRPSTPSGSDSLFAEVSMHCFIKDIRGFSVCFLWGVTCYACLWIPDVTWLAFILLVHQLDSSLEVLINPCSPFLPASQCVCVTFHSLKLLTPTVKNCHWYTILLFPLSLILHTLYKFTPVFNSHRGF